MLQFQTVTESTLALLRVLMRLPELKAFFLVGGTNISLKLGHRISVDLDLFTDAPFDSDALLRTLEGKFPDLIIIRHTPGAVLAYIQKIKVDFIVYEYELLQPVEEVDGFRFASLPDVSAMKINAVSRRGVKKDFWDIAELLDHFCLNNCSSFSNKNTTLPILVISSAHSYILPMPRIATHH